MNRRFFLKSVLNKTTLALLSLNLIYIFSSNEKKIKSLNNSNWYLNSND